MNQTMKKLFDIADIDKLNEAVDKVNKIENQDVITIDIDNNKTFNIREVTICYSSLNAIFLLGQFFGFLDSIPTVKR